MINRANALLALGVFGAVFCVTFWRDALFQGVGLAMENAPPEARTYSALTTVTDVKFQKAKERVVDADTGEPVDRAGPLRPAWSNPKDNMIATMVRKDGGNRLCRIMQDGSAAFRWIVDYDDTHFSETDAMKFTWRASGCDAAIKARGEVVTSTQAMRRIVALVPRTPEFAQEREIRTGNIYIFEHDGENPPDNLPPL